MGDNIDRALEYHVELLGHKQNIQKAALEMGRVLNTINDEKLFRELDYTAFTKYLADPEVDIYLGTAYALRRIHRRFVMQLGLPINLLTTIGMKRLGWLLPFITEENMGEWIPKAQELEYTAFVDEVKQWKQSQKQLATPVDESSTPTLSTETETSPPENTVVDDAPSISS